MSESLIILLSVDKVLCAQVRDALAGSPLRLLVAPTREAVLLAAAEDQPGAIVVDVTSGLAPNVGVLVREIRNHCDPGTPILCLIDFSLVSARVAALRAGALRCIAKPLHSARLGELLADVACPIGTPPVSVLIVDDDEAVAQHHAELLIMRGVDARTVSDSTQVLDVMRDFVPDVLLLDMYMPGLSGLEVAALLREDDRYLNVPIVFLSVERQFERQLAALSWGGDLFLTKPVGPAELATVVFSRARRARRLLAWSKGGQSFAAKRNAQAEPIEAWPVTILYVDGSLEMQSLVRDLFSQWTLVTLITSNKGGLACQLAETSRPHLIILGVDLPDMDGFEVLRKLRAAPLTTWIPVLALSENTAPSERKRAMDAGFQGLLTMPIQAGEFFRNVKTLLTDVVTDEN